jgi:hypothetical protein
MSVALLREMFEQMVVAKSLGPSRRPDMDLATLENY